MPLNLSQTDRRAVVGGATQGMGKAIATELASQGAELILLARNRDRLERMTDELPAAPGVRHSFYSLDYSDLDAVKSVAEELDAGAPVHILVNNTGGPEPGAAQEASVEQFSHAFTQHLLAFQILTQAIIPGMREARFGRIINIISYSVIQPIRGLGVSNTIRAAVAQWGRTLADELGPNAITVNNVLPGLTSTERLRSLFQHRASLAGTTYEQMEQLSLQSIPVRKFASPEDIAGVVAFLASESAGCINGVNLPIDGGRLAAMG